MYSRNLRPLIYFLIAEASLPLDRKREMVRKFGQKGTYWGKDFLKERINYRERTRAAYFDCPSLAHSSRGSVFFGGEISKHGQNKENFVWRIQRIFQEKNRPKSPYFERKKSEVSIFRQYCTFLELTKTKQAFKNISSQIWLFPFVRNCESTYLTKLGKTTLFSPFPSWFCCQVCFMAQNGLKCFFLEVVLIMQISVKNWMGNIVIRLEVVSFDTIIDIKAIRSRSILLWYYHWYQGYKIQENPSCLAMVVFQW